MPRAPHHLKAIKKLLAGHGEMQQAALCKATGLRASTFIGAVKPGLRTGEVLERREGRSTFYRLAEGVDPLADWVAPPRDQKPHGEAPAAPKFNASLWADGELILWNVELNPDGRSLTLNVGQVAMVRRLLGGGQ